MPSRRVAIVGAATSDCGRVDDKTAFELCFQGTTRALADAGIDRSEVDGFMSLNGTLPPVELTEYLGLRPNWAGLDGARRAACGSSCSSTRPRPSPRAWSRSSC